MAEPKDMIMPMLREMRSEMGKRFDAVDARLDRHEARLDRIDERQKSFSQAIAGDSFMSKMLIGDWEERIEALETRVRELEARK